MQLFETNVVFDKNTQKEVIKALRILYMKKYLIQILVSFTFFIVLFVIDRIDIIFFFLSLAFCLYAVHSIIYYYILNLLRLAKDKRLLPDEENREYVFVTYFDENEFVIRDSKDYKDNIIMTLSYDTIHWFIETKTLFVFRVKTKSSWIVWHKNFGIINKASIENSGKREELLEFLSCKCKNIRFKLFTK